MLRFIELQELKTKHEINAAKENESKMKTHTRAKSYMKPLYELVALPTLVAFFCLVHREFNCLRISSIEVPAAVWNGSQVTFSCNYVLAPDEQLYSVKWYKNYVEFYRFQPQQPSQEQPTSIPPQEAPAPAAAGQVGQNLNLNRADEAAGTRHEFELDGINLDLSKSNATQVHLRQVSLSSEATFKCEVSADSPTFATVSAERQLKVYVLPKQRLALFDNSGNSQASSVTSTVGTTLKPSQNNEQPTTRIQNNSKQLIYLLNDIVNFTCVAGSSRPAARLSWFLNDELIVAPNSTRDSSGASVVEASEISYELRQMPNKLIESRSTLILRLQASQLKLLRKQTTGASMVQRNQATFSSSILPLKLSCRSHLSVEFYSEASVQVSNGKPTSSKSNSRRREFISSVPTASSWTNDNQDNNRFQYPEEAMDSRQSRRPLKEQRSRLAGSTMDALTEAWIGSVDDRSGAVSQENRRQQRTRHNVVWTQRQLRAQADRIEQFVQRSKPNQLEAPHIEARSMRRERAELSTSGEPDVERDPSGELDEEERTTPSPPSIVISSNQFGLADDVSPPSGDQFRSRELDRDYELDEVVNFTCHPAIPSGDYSVRNADDPPISIHIKWLINNQEITGNQVNSFDGERFHFSQKAAASGEYNRTLAKQHTSNWLLVEFTSSLLQVKELILKCRTIVEQPLAEDESAHVISLSSSPFIQASPEQMLGQRPAMRPSMFTVRDPQQRQQFGAGARYQSSPGADQAATGIGNQRQRANVIRMRQSQQARSHSNSNNNKNQLSLFVVWLCLAVGILTSRPLHEQHVR